MYLTGFLFTNFFVQNMYFNDILSKLYQVQGSDNSNKHSSKIINKPFQSISSLRNRSDNKMNKNLSTGHADSEIEINKNETYNDSELNSTVDEFKNELKNRRLYSYHTCNYAK